MLCNNPGKVCRDEPGGIERAMNKHHLRASGCPHPTPGRTSGRQKQKCLGEGRASQEGRRTPRLSCLCLAQVMGLELPGEEWALESQGHTWSAVWNQREALLPAFLQQWAERGRRASKAHLHLVGVRLNANRKRSASRLYIVTLLT